MHQKIRNSLLRVVAVFLAFLILFPQIAGLTMPAFAAGSIIKKLEDNPFDGLRWATKQPISGYHGSYPTEIMGVTIDGVNYVAYCLNHDRYGSGDSPTVGEYGVKIYELDDPALQSNEEFINDKNILMYMQGVLASGGYTGGGDSAATALRIRSSSRQLFNNRFEAYGVTKFAMWTLSVGEDTANKWSVNPTATYDASRNQYLLESLNQIMGSANNWNDWVDDEIHVNQKTNSEGEMWQDGPGPGEKYVEWEVTTGYFGNGKVQDSEHVYMAAGGYTLTPGSLPEGFHLEKLDGTEIKSATTMQSQYVNAWLGEPFRLVAESGTDPSSFGEEKTVATINGKLHTGGLKYGIAEYSGSTKVQNYALVPENGLQAVSAEVKLDERVPTNASFVIRKADGSKNLAGAQFKVTKADNSWSTNVTTGTSGSISVNVPSPGMYYVEETKAPSGYALDSTRYSVEAKSGEVVELKVENSKSVGLKIQKLDALTDEPLAGAVFTVEQIDGTFSTDVTSNDNGLCVLGGLEPGSYRITEKTPPAGYQPAENPVQTIEIQKDQVEVPMIVYKNEPINGTVKIIKTAENNGDPLEGVTFEIKRRDGAEKWSVVTDENGEAEIELPADWYVITETDAPDNVEIDPTPHTVELKPGQTYELKLTNVLKKQLIIEKRDSVTNALVPGMIFEIKSPDGDLFGPGNCGRGEGIYQTDENGQITFDTMETGTSWVITELEAPAGYVLNSTPQTVKIVDDVTTVTIRNDQKPGLMLTKVDADTGKRIMGAKFTFTIPGTQTVYTRVTDNNGVIFLEDLDVTSIVIQEIEPAPGYIANDKPVTVQLKPNERTDVTFKNTSKPGLRICKIDTDGNPVADVVIKVSKTDGQVVGEYTTDESGIIFIPNLEAGTYDVQEISAPPQYVVDSTVHRVTLEAGKIGEITLRNSIKPTLCIVKVDSVTKGPIEGVTFEVRVTDGGKIGDYVTDENGEIFVTGLQAGVNYTIREIATLPGYVLDETPKQITLEANKVTTVQFENKAKSPVYILKLDAKTGKGVPGVRFRVTRADGSLIGEVVTDSTGRATLTNVPSGYITVTEIAVPDGYVLDPTPQTKLVDGENPVEFVFENEPYGSILIKKRNASTQNPLSGAIFKVTTADGTLIGDNYTSGADGTVLVSGLDPTKTYIVTETRAPDGFEISEGPKTVTVKPGETVELVFEDKRIENFTIRKIGSDGKPIGGVTFVVSTLAGAEVARVTTGSDGLAVLTDIQPGSYKVQEVSVPDGVILDTTPQTVEVVAGKPTTLTFVNEYVKEFTIRKVGSDGKPIGGVTFLISTLAGAEVAKVTTGSDGLAVLTDMQPGTYKVQEIAVPDGVILDPTPQTVEVVAGKPTTLTFVNDYEGGLKILKKVTQTSKPLKGVTFRITKPDGSLIGEYTTDANGEIFVELEPQTVVVRETRVPSGYKLDSTPRTVEIKPNETTVLEFENDRLGSIVIHKIDADTDRGLYGAVFLLMDEDYHTIAQLVTDRDGYAELDEDIPDGVYYLREIKAPDGYTLDDRIKRIIVKNGSTEEILWENSKTQGQIQIIKKSADYNPITGKPAGSLLEGAIFEITRADTGVVVDRIVSDYRGVAASGPLPIGRYKIREITAPDYYQLNTTEFEVQLKVPNDVVQVEVLNNTANISTSVKKQGNTTVTPGQQMRYDFWDICNLSNVPLENFFWHDQIPTDAVRLNVIHTGTWNQPGLTYKVTYKTNLNSSYRDLATGLLSTQSYDLDCSASRLGLASNEYITDFRFEFGTVKAGFREENRPMILVTVLPNLANGYRFANRTDVGGKYNDKWFTSDYTWVTQVIAPPIKYPTTGY